MTTEQVVTVDQAIELFRADAPRLRKLLDGGEGEQVMLGGVLYDVLPPKLAAFYALIAQPGQQLPYARGVRAATDAIEPINSIARSVMIEKRRTDFIELAVYSALNSDGIDYARWFLGNRFFPGNRGTLELGQCSEAKIAASTPTGQFGTSRAITADTPTTTYATTDATSRTGTWTGSNTVDGVTDIDHSSTVGDSVTYDVVVPAGGRIYTRGYANTVNGGVMGVSIEDSGASEIAAAEYLPADVSGTRKADFVDQGNGLVLIPLAEVVDADTYTVTLTVDADSVAGGRLYDGGIEVYGPVAFDAVGVHGTVLATSLSGETTDATFRPGTVLVYEVDSATAVSFDYVANPTAGIVTATVFDTAGSQVAQETIDMAVGSARVSEELATGLTQGTYYVHVFLQDTTNGTDTRLYAVEVVGRDENQAGTLGVDTIDLQSMPAAPASAADTGTHQIAGPGNWMAATQWRAPESVVGDEEFVSGVHGFESYLNNGDLTVTVDGVVVDWAGAALGDTFVGDSIIIDCIANQYFPVAYAGDTGTAITAIAQANPAQVTSAGHGLNTGDEVRISGVAGMTQINDAIATVTVIDANTYTLDGIDSTGYSAYTSGGVSQTPFGTLRKVLTFRRGALVLSDTTLTLTADAVMHTNYMLMLQCPNGGDTRSDDVGGGYVNYLPERGAALAADGSDNSSEFQVERSEAVATHNDRYAVYGALLNARELQTLYADYLGDEGGGLLRDNSTNTGKWYTIAATLDTVNGMALPAGHVERAQKAYRVVPTTEGALVLGQTNGF